MDADLLSRLNLSQAFDIAVDMLQNAIDAYQSEDSALARKIFEMDKKMDGIQRSAFEILVEYLPAHPQCMAHGLNLMLIHRKLERIGDLMKNIAEEIIFYLEAKVLKHQFKVARAG